MIYLNKFIRLFGGIKMSLLKCPECNHDVSEYADTCPNCGCPISVIKNKKTEKENNIKNNLPDKCPICGTSSNRINQEMRCPVCGYLYNKTKEELTDYQQKRRLLPDYCPICHSPKEKINSNFECTICGYNLIKKTKTLNINPNQSTSTKQRITQATCPYCKSTNTKKISAASRAGSILGFGLFSKKLGKEWHCNNCNSDF